MHIRHYRLSAGRDIGQAAAPNPDSEQVTPNAPFQPSPNPPLNGVTSRATPQNSFGHTCTSTGPEKTPCGASACANQNPIIDALVSLVDRLDQLNALLSRFDSAKSKRRSPVNKTPITRAHEARAKALNAEGRTATEIAEALGISRTSASLLLHDKYPFAVSQQLNS